MNSSTVLRLGCSSVLRKPRRCLDYILLNLLFIQATSMYLGLGVINSIEGLISSHANNLLISINQILNIMAIKPETIIKHYFIGVRKEVLLRHRVLKRNTLILVYKGKKAGFYITFGQLLRISAGQRVTLPKEVKEGIINLEGQ